MAEQGQAKTVPRRHRVDKGVLTALRLIVGWYLTLSFALLAVVSWRWEVVAGAAALGAGCDLLRRPRLARVLARAYDPLPPRRTPTGPIEIWFPQSVRRECWFAVASALYWVLVVLLIWVVRPPLPEALLPLLDHLWNAGDNVRELLARGYPARELSFGYLAALLYWLLVVMIMIPTSEFPYHAIYKDEKIRRAKMQWRLVIYGLLAWAIIFIMFYFLMFGKPINWKYAHLHGFTPEAGSLVVSSWVSAVIAAFCSRACYFSFGRALVYLDRPAQIDRHPPTLAQTVAITAESHTPRSEEKRLVIRRSRWKLFLLSAPIWLCPFLMILGLFLGKNFFALLSGFYFVAIPLTPFVIISHRRQLFGKRKAFVFYEDGLRCAVIAGDEEIPYAALTPSPDQARHHFCILLSEDQGDERFDFLPIFDRSGAEILALVEECHRAGRFPADENVAAGDAKLAQPA